MQSGSFPQGEVTGYFGPKTELAVKNWQASRGVVANGTPDTTGYGVVGPTTRTSLNRDCSYMAIAKVPQTGEDTSIIVIRNITNSNNPVVTGTADNAKNIRVVVYKGQNSITNVLTDADIVYSSDTISDKEIVITDGRWTDTVEEFLSKGQYTLDVYFTNINNSETSHVTEVFTVETW